MKSILTDCIRADSEYRHLLDTLTRQRSSKQPLPVIAAGLCDGATDALTVSLLTDVSGRGWGCTLIVCAEEKECVRTVSLLKDFGRSAVYFPARDLTLYNVTASHEFEYERLMVLSGILVGAYDAVVTTPDAALGYTIPPARLKQEMISLYADDTVDVDSVCNRLASAGFARVELTEGAGQFARRGGIIDVYPPYAVYDMGDCEKVGSYPVRIELFGDEIDRMGIFDPETQRFTEGIAGVRMTPAREVLINDETKQAVRRAISVQTKKVGDDRARDELKSELTTLENSSDVGFLDKYISLIYPEKTALIDYFKPCSPLFIRGTQAVADRLKSSEWMANQTVTELVEAGTVAGKYAEYSKPAAELERFADSALTLHLDSLSHGMSGKKIGGLFGFRTKHTVSYAGNFGLLCDDLDTYLRSDYRIVLAVENETAAKSMYELLSDKGMRVYMGVDKGDFTVSTLPKASILIRVDPGLRGYELVVPKIAVLTTRPESRGSSAGGTKMKKKSRRRPGTEAIMSYNELEVGDLVVHETYGIGQYLGIENLTVQGVSRDYIKIKYAGSDRLFLPVEKMDMVSRYIGANAEDGKVKLSHFGGAEWGRAKSKARAAVADIAKDLIKLYAERMKRPGFAFPADDDFQRDFEASFEYNETAGQLDAIDDIKADMTRAVPMDRLLCGDVGYGKTEVAFRAAYKAVLGGKQVAILVPTTILALQHYQTAMSRMRGFPVTIDMVSRFRTPKQQAATIRAVGRGDVDIIIGTHRLLSKDVEFKNLGLLIIDEEQRFGVAQKEKIKQLCGNIDVLSLSATPIPRTLNMAMGGIRDISVLDEAPGDRLPIQTYVLEHDELIIVEAIRREMRRGGQVFYLHNVVEDIDLVAGRLRKALPDAHIVTAHGKMEHEQLEEIWQKMLMGEIDILVCTTIIETGVDVPNANTLIIEDADKMGLAQLHQIRGRVGRSSRRAYAYFTYSKNKEISEIAQRRLSAIREFTEFGSGFRIAMRDLEIRGAGNILGAQQHGHMEAVGYDMYLQILSETIEEEKTGIEAQEKKECLIDISVDAHIPESYIDSVKNRIGMYKRIAEIETKEDAMDVLDEFIDRFGEPPKACVGLIDVALLRAQAANLGIYEIKQQNSMLLAFVSELKPQFVSAVGHKLRGKAMISAAKSNPYISYKLTRVSPVEGMKELIEALSESE